MAAPVYSGIFNVTEGLPSPWNVPGLYADGTHATDNTTNLNSMISWLLSSSGPTNGQGGTLEFPSAGTYAFSGPITISKDQSGTKQPYAIILKGDGQGRINAPILKQTASADFFVVDNNTSGSEDIGGIAFQDLMLSFSSGASGSIAAVHVKGGSNNVRLYRCILVDCPIGYWLEHSEQCSMLDCTVYNASNAGIPLMLGIEGSNPQAIETYVAGNLFLCYGRTDGIAVQIYGAEHLRMINNRLEGWGQGILITPVGTSSTAQKLYFANVSCFTNSGAAVLIEVSGGTSQNPKFVTQVWFEACEFNPAGGSITGYNDGGIVIGGTDSNDVVDQVRFVDCYSVLWAGPGLRIEGGANIEILGGYYSCNGTNTSPASADLRSGIDISGAATGVRINGVACNNAVYDIYLATPGPAPATQLYGLYVSSGATSIRVHACDLTSNVDNGVVVDGSVSAPTNVFIKHCDFTGLSTPVKVTAPVSNLQITDCAGYNDQGTILSGFVAGGTVNVRNDLWGYYGPLEFYAASGTGTINLVTVDGHGTNLTSGSFYLTPGESASVSWTPPTGSIHLLVIGK
jgi:hypothetical protein